MKMGSCRWYYSEWVGQHAEASGRKHGALDSWFIFFQVCGGPRPHLLDRPQHNLTSRNREFPLPTEFLYQKSQVLIALALLGFLALAGELGYRLGRRGQQTHDVSTRTQITSIQAAVIGLLSLLLGFTFAMTLSTFEYRKQMVIEESNAIGTAALRAQFLPAHQEAEVSELLRRYVEIRLESVLHTVQASPVRQQLDSQIRQLQNQLWGIANGAAETDPHSVPLGLFVQAVNELINSKAKRDIGVANHVPEGVLLLMMGFAVLAVGVLGYGNGLTDARNLSLTAGYSIIVVLVILLIIDLDHPQQGLVRVSQTSMIQLQEILNARQR